MTKLNIEYSAGTARFPLYCQYPAQIEPQPAYISLDLQTGDVDADYSGEIGNGMPADQWHEVVLTFRISPTTTADGISQVIEDNRDAFQKILDTSAVEWDGSNHVGVLTQESRDFINSWELEVDVEGGILDLHSLLGDSPFPYSEQGLDDFIADLLAVDGDSGYWLLDELATPKGLSEAVLEYWAEIVYDGNDIPANVAKILISANTCGPAWASELSEFAATGVAA